MHDFYRRITDALERGETVAHLKVIRVDGSGPQAVGASMLLREDGSFEGTIGGGAVEAAALKDAAAMLEKRKSGIVEYKLTAELGMCCGGVMQIFCEVLEPTRRLLIYGAGHVAQPTATLAAQCGFQVTVIDEREEWANPRRYPSVKHILNSNVEEALEELPTRERDFVVVVTRGHEQDQTVLEHYLKSPPAYLGVIGSLSKVTRAISRCKAKGFQEEQLGRVNMPIGLDIGAITPQEIAVAIVAELIAHHRGRQERVSSASMASLNRIHRARRSEKPSLPLSPSMPMADDGA